MERGQKPKSVLIIEDDVFWRRSIKKFLNQHGITGVEYFEDGEVAWTNLDRHKKPQYDLIILDWKVPTVNGLSLLNRIRRSDCYSDTPVLIISGFLQDDDFRLFEEFPLTEGLAKPIDLSTLTKSIESIMAEATWLQLNREEILRIFAKIDLDDAQTLFQLRQLVAKAPKPNAVVIAAAKLLIYSERFFAAEELLSYFLDDTPDSLCGLNLLAKVYLHTGRFNDAGTILEKAQKISPKNLERLCILGEAKLLNLQIDEAQRVFAKALEIDSENIQARVGRDFAGMVGPKVARLSDDSIPRAYLSLLNSTGIVAARAGKFSNAIDQYRSAMIYTVDPLTKARVAFNIGLAYVRWSKPDEALPWLQRSITYSKGKFKKSGAKLAELTDLIKNASGQQKDGNILVSPKGTETRPASIRASSAPSIGFDSSDLDRAIEDFEVIDDPNSLDFREIVMTPAKKVG